MTYRYSFETEEQREALLKDSLAKGKILIEEQQIHEGNFLIFMDKPIETARIETLEEQGILLKAQNQSISERADFIEDIIAEIAMEVYK